MLTTLWNSLIVNPILNVLVGFYHLTGSLGVAIILFTILFRFLLLPIMLPSMRSMKKQKELMPEIQKIKQKYKGDQKKLAEAQMALFKEHGLNPMAGCLPQIGILFVLGAMFSVIRKLTLAENVMDLNALIYLDQFKFAAEHISTRFLYFDLATADKFLVLPILAGIFQFFTSKFSMGFTKKAEKIAKKTPDKKDDIAYTMQEQMLYILPVITVIIGLSLPSGVNLYIVVTTLFSLVQTYLMMGDFNKANKNAKKN